MKRPCKTALRSTKARSRKRAASAGGDLSRERAARAKRILGRLRRQYPDADCALGHRSALELLVSTILSAQCTDDRVNKVTPALFRRYPTAADYAAADQAEVEKLVQSTGFFRNKARNIIGLGRMLTETFGGQVPDTMEELVRLPGVARKTANVVLGAWFNKNEGVVVDTHVGRLAHRLGLTWRSRDEKDAERIEKDLMELFARKDWTFLGHALIWHGRRVCTARKPNCPGCPLIDLCPSAERFVRERRAADE